ncbi:hypothetical protein ACH0CP_10745 [Sphingomonas sp. 179-I 2A4 NHS]|jgi:hypothetical protein|uniref:hypothetical protein n=1 Tax=unclassified Sphingomonas TaxID=196159 RepID=UPI0038792D99
MDQSLTPFVPSAVEGAAAGASLAARSTTMLGRNAVGAGLVPGLSYARFICQRPPMFVASPMLRKTRQRLNFLNIREVA